MSAPKVLVVDNDTLQRQMYHRVLSKSGYQALIATSGPEALVMIESERPDLVLTDVVMPQMDGVRFARALRAAPATADLPVILMTGLRVPESMLEAAAGSLAPCGFHQKGADIELLLGEIERLLKGRALPS
jgi:CheY-like chemotaxis protein